MRDPEQHFGLLRNDLSPKPAFTAIKTLIAALRASPGAGPGDLDWRSTPTGDEDVEHLTLLRRDGSRVIALWRPVSVWDPHERPPVDPGSVPVELRLRRPARDVTVWRPSVSTTPVLRRAQRAPAAARPGRRPRAGQPAMSAGNGVTCCGGCWPAGSCARGS